MTDEMTQSLLDDANAARKIGRFKRGLIPHNRLNLPEDEIVSAYQSGISELALAKQFGCSCGGIKNLLIRNGIERRSGSWANVLRMGRMTSEERNALIAVARKTRISNMREDSIRGIGHGIGIGEREIADALIAKGWPVVRQELCEGYVIDISIGHIDIEVKFKRRGFMSQFSERSEKLLKSGDRQKEPPTASH